MLQKHYLTEEQMEDMTTKELLSAADYYESVESDQ